MAGSRALEYLASPRAGDRGVARRHRYRSGRIPRARGAAGKRCGWPLGNDGGQAPSRRVARVPRRDRRLQHPARETRDPTRWAREERALNREADRKSPPVAARGALAPYRSRRWANGRRVAQTARDSPLTATSAAPFLPTLRRLHIVERRSFVTR